LLELLFRTIEAHESSILELQAQAAGQERLEAAALGRLSAAQDEHAAGTTQSLRKLESRLEGQQRTAEAQHAAVDERLKRLELRLRGVSNAAGRQAALDDIASMLGVAVPQQARHLLSEALARVFNLQGLPLGSLACTDVAE
jgi:hypothetical protein